MSNENELHISSLEKLLVHFGGYFDGIIDEIKEEICEVERWPQNIRLGNTIRRQDQELVWLNRLKEEMQRAQSYINASIKKELEK